jgi:C1A family cysteine protease
MLRVACLFLFLRLANANLDRFFDWAKKHEINLPSDGKDFSSLLEKWIENDRIIKDVNSKNLSYTLDHNQFSGMNREDFRKILTPILSQSVGSDGLFKSSVGAPASWDWRSKGAVTPVKNQLNCGSCYSFSTTGALEGAYQIKTGELISFSEQQILDCDFIKNGGNALGCDGGDMGSVMSWIGKNNGLCSESEYPYYSGTTSKVGKCDTTCGIISGSDIQKVVNVAPNSESSFVSALYQQPISVAIEADEPGFQFYKSGIYTGKCSTNLDHGVLAVGYAPDYWTVKNSWGTSYGEEGYIRLARGDYNGKSGQCGILIQPVYPVL